MVGGGLQNIFKIPELKRKVFFTMMILAVYRIGVHVPTPGMDQAALARIFAKYSEGMLGLFNMFSGGALERLSVFALGIMPYISASIILQLLTVAVPHLERLSKEGEQGRKKITQYTRYGTVVLSVIQGFGISVGLEQMGAVIHPGWGFRILTVLTLTAGTAFIMWLGEQITERGIGNGISLIIFAGIVARLPSAISTIFRLVATDAMTIFTVILLAVLAFVVVGCIVFFEQGQRRIPVQYAKRVVGRKMYGGQSTHLPLKVNTSGVIPPIFASSIIMFPATAAGFITIPFIAELANSLRPGNWVYNLLYISFIVFFCFFYTAVTFKPDDVAENMKKQGGYIPGIRPGKKTADYIDRVLTRITVGGAIYLSIVCIFPSLLYSWWHIDYMIASFFGGTSLLILVGVAIDTVSQIESHMLTRHYEGFLKKGVKSRG
ncbi:MAG: preprotein translocase subunit SecY [Desulfobacterales bacterium]|jgi:preprotein translocase subunit SecY|nr:preprotein translocase subunit SecY [Desulfobacteraceae bacterium]MBT4365243.1 preprotein translocase subunit SecY [Desulfobacteraceae bacterium]MBT7086369.1 preprotein translocase subunit SecY [Desulfobacterales bacterium]MBT7696266.1 preprotein translocase subunit SecY [Desulfobacterales bacterium]